ncbi:MAG: acyltransferase [Oligoflexia bacterium]|nr:acyltransferase [Oligoflexia bacterium]
MKLRHRLEIDGLRALAVTLVVLYHAGIFGVTAGFFGVDVFFVISGYLISRIIINDLENDSFRMASFLERRARRILPVLFFIVFFCTPIAIIYMIPYQLVDFGKSVIATLLFVSNILFWRESSYFSQASELKPLLHTWSLAIEEQFYLMYPWIMLILKRSWWWRVFFLVSTIALSLICSHWMSANSIVVANFFLLPSRIFELMLGALAAHFQHQCNKVRDIHATYCSVLGLVGIVVSAFVFSASTPHPSLWTLIPVLSTTFVLLFARPQSLVTQFLSFRPFVFIGLLSYSLYLWHNPVFAFAKLKGVDSTSPTTALILIGISLLGSYVTWRWIENPIRLSRVLKSSRSLLLALSGGAILLLSIGIIFVQTKGFIQRYSSNDRNLLEINPTVLGRYTEKIFRDNKNTQFDDSISKKKWLVVGDSYAQDFVNMMAESKYIEKIQLKTYGIAVRCPKYVGTQDILQYYLDANDLYDKKYCENYSNLNHVVEIVKTADVVVLANHWRTWEANLILETIQNIRSDLNEKFLILGAKDFGDIRPLDYLGLSLNQKLKLKNKISSESLEANSIFRRLLRPENFIDLEDLLCEDSECPIFTTEGELISFDGHHFTPAGAKFAGIRIFEHF